MIISRNEIEVVKMANKNLETQMREELRKAPVLTSEAGSSMKKQSLLTVRRRKSDNYLSNDRLMSTRSSFTNTPVKNIIFVDEK